METPIIKICFRCNSSDLNVESEVVSCLNCKTSLPLKTWNDKPSENAIEYPTGRTVPQW